MHGPVKLPRWTLVAVALVLVSGVLARAPIVDSLTGEPSVDARLSLTAAYLILAPFGAFLDHLSLLTDRQHVFVLLGLLAAFMVWRVIRRFTSTARGGVRREIGLAGGAFVGVLLVYAFGVLGTRPMAAISVTDPDLVIVDFHSHTEASHDGRPGLGPSDRRAWHDGAGFDLVYVTDHVTIEGAVAAEAENPRLVGDGVSLVVGREVRFHDQHVLVLGPLDPLEIEADADFWPVLIQTLPNNLSRVPVPYEDGSPNGGVLGIELIDADPRGLRQSVEEREHILAIADSLDLALVAGSNHHGWGRAAAAWTLMRVQGWQAMEPTELARRIEDRIRSERGGATWVVERPRLAGGVAGANPILEALTLPRLLWHTLVSLTAAERISWLIWIALATVLLAMLPRRRATVDLTTRPELELEQVF